MRKKLDTRFPAARIKKIMQADEDVGKIAMAVPVLVSKALELFLQDLCDRTYDITLRRGAKTVNSLHLKHCVQSYNVFDFLREVVSKVPDYVQSDAVVDDRTIAKRRKVSADELNESDEESKRSRTNDVGHTSSSGRGRGRGQGRGRGRSSLAEREPSRNEVELQSFTSSVQQSSKEILSPRGLTDKELPKDETAVSEGINEGVQNFDLNAGLDENADKTAATSATAAAAAAAGCSSSAEPSEGRNDEIPGWSLSEMDRMAVDSLDLVRLNSRLDEEEEDYDEEG